MLTQLDHLCTLLKECDVGCIVLTSRYVDFCHPEQDSAPGVFISPLNASSLNPGKSCSPRLKQSFLIAPFVKCELDEINQILKIGNDLRGPLVEAWEAFYKIKECIECENDKQTCKNVFTLNRVSGPDVCGPHVVLPTVWDTEYFC